MKQLIPMDEYGVFGDTKDTARANSLRVAEVFGKRHDNVLADIRNLDCSKKFSLLNFQESTYKDGRGKRHRTYHTTTTGAVTDIVLQCSPRRQGAKHEISW